MTLLRVLCDVFTLSMCALVLAMGILSLWTLP